MPVSPFTPTPYSAPPASASQSNSKPGATTASGSIALPEGVVKGDILLGIDTLGAAGKVAGADGMDNPLPVLISADRFKELHGKILGVADGERTEEMRQFMAAYGEIMNVVDQLKNKAAELKKLGIDVDVMHWDPSSKGSWAALLAEIQQRLNDVTALLNQTSALQLAREQELNDQAQKEALDVAGKGMQASYVGAAVGVVAAGAGAAVAGKSAWQTAKSKSSTEGSVPNAKTTELNTGRPRSGSRQEGETEGLEPTTPTRRGSTIDGETDTETGTIVQGETNHQRTGSTVDDGRAPNPNPEGVPAPKAGSAGDKASADGWDAVARVSPVVAHPLSEFATADLRMSQAEEQAHVQATEMAKSTAAKESEFAGTSNGSARQSAQDIASQMKTLAQQNVDSLAAVV